MSFLSHPTLRRDLERYESLLCGAAPGVHEAIARTLARHVPHRAGVIDIGAGTGALLLRLRNAGFDGLHAADLARDNFALEDVPHTCVDLNTDFSAAIKDRFDVVVASEVIEHLDSPRHALREIREILRPGGYLLLTMPNVGFWEGRLKFLLKGELWGFSEDSYRSIRHISPLPAGLLSLTLREIGFEPVVVTTAGSFATVLRWVLLAPLWVPLFAIGGRRILGECTLILARRSDPDADLRMPAAYRDVWKS
jgi:SAM-dependent methyltransferase